MSLIDQYPVALALTLGVEVPLVVLLAPAHLRRRTALDGLLANLFTHPLAWWLVVHRGAGFAAVEVGVALCEALVYWRLTGHTARRAALLSVLANGATVGLSFML